MIAAGGALPAAAVPADALGGLLERTLPGLTLGDAVSTIVSLDLGALRVREEARA